MPQSPINSGATVQNAGPQREVTAVLFRRERQDDLPFADVSMAHALICCLFRHVAALSMLACSSAASPSSSLYIVCTATMVQSARLSSLKGAAECGE